MRTIFRFTLLTLLTSVLSALLPVSVYGKLFCHLPFWDCCKFFQRRWMFCFLIHLISKLYNMQLSFQVWYICYTHIQLLFVTLFHFIYLIRNCLFYKYSFSIFCRHFNVQSLIYLIPNHIVYLEIFNFIFSLQISMFSLVT